MAWTALHLSAKACTWTSKSRLPSLLPFLEGTKWTLSLWLYLLHAQGLRSQETSTGVFLTAANYSGPRLFLKNYSNPTIVSPLTVNPEWMRGCRSINPLLSLIFSLCISQWWVHLNPSLYFYLVSSSLPSFGVGKFSYIFICLQFTPFMLQGQFLCSGLYSCCSLFLF